MSDIRAVYWVMFSEFAGHLNAASLRYRAKIISIKELLQAYEEGEAMVGSLEFNFDTIGLKNMIGKRSGTK